MSKFVKVSKEEMQEVFRITYNLNKFAISLFEEQMVELDLKMNNKYERSRKN